MWQSFCAWWVQIHRGILSQTILTKLQSLRSNWDLTLILAQGIALKLLLQFLKDFKMIKILEDHGADIHILDKQNNNV